MGIGATLGKIFGQIFNKSMAYTIIYNRALIKLSKEQEVKLISKRILEGKERYEGVAETLDNGIPWWFIGITHFMEAGHKYPKQFDYHLHCGDPLTARTFHVPSGRPIADPKAGKGKPYTWEESALDALKYMKYDKVTDWSIENCLILFENCCLSSGDTCENDFATIKFVLSVEAVGTWPSTVNIKELAMLLPNFNFVSDTSIVYSKKSKGFIFLSAS